MTQLEDDVRELMAKSGVIAGPTGGFWCMTCQRFIPPQDLRGKIFRLATHRVGRAIHSVRRINPFEAPPEQ